MSQVEASIAPMPFDKDGAMHVPYALFTDPAVYAQEQERIFGGSHWCFLGLAAEIPEHGDFKSTAIGDTPVVVTRGREGVIHAWVNRCSHRGAMVCRSRSGNSKVFRCIYHQWTFRSSGDLMGVPFRNGIEGKGGMPEGFAETDHGLRKIRTAEYKGLIFGTMAPEGEVEPIVDYLGADLVAMIDRIFARPIEILGTERQLIKGNWKLYAENVRDAYHASLLHLFHATFGTFRSNQEGATLMDGHGRHVTGYAKIGSDKGTEESYKDLRTYQAGKFALEDPSVLSGTGDFDDGMTTVIATAFPSLVIQQILGSLAVRQIVTHSADSFELVWTYFGYADDTPEARHTREKQMNFVGPGGLISMEDGEAIEIVQTAIVRDGERSSYVGMGVEGGDGAHLVSEVPIAALWKYYASVMEGADTQVPAE